MNMDTYRKKQAKSAPPKKTTSGDNVVEIHAQKDPDQDIQQAIEDHYHGKELTKEAKKLVDKSRYLQRIVRQKVLDTRAEDRPKRYEFSGNVLGTNHTVKVSVKEGGYRPFDDETRSDIENIGVTFDDDGNKVGKSKGELFLEKAITETTNCKIDFSLIPEDKKEQVFNHLLEVNQICGITDQDIENGAIPIAEMVFSNVPNSDYHKHRTILSAKEDKKLETITPASISY